MEIIEEYAKYPLKNAIYITEATYIGDFAIRVFFSDDHQRLVDFKPFLQSAKHPTIKKYLDESFLNNSESLMVNLDGNDFDLCFPIQDWNLYTNSIVKEKAFEW